MMVLIIIIIIIIIIITREALDIECITHARHSIT